MIPAKMSKRRCVGQQVIRVLLILAVNQNQLVRLAQVKQKNMNQLMVFVIPLVTASVRLVSSLALKQ